MKKILFFTLMIFMLAVGTSFAAECECGCGGCGGPIGLGGATVLNAYIPPIDAPGCPNVCQDAPGAIDYDGESLSIFDYGTGEGYDCRKPKNNGCAVFPVCFCDKVDELEKDHEYGLVLEIMTPGAAFYSEASITPDVIRVSSYEGKDDICEDGSPSNVEYLDFIYDDVRQTVIVTDTSSSLLNQDLYLGVSIPPIIVDQSVVSEGTIIEVRITLYDGEKVCAPYCTTPMCNCTIPVAVMACWNDCCATLSYLTTDQGWWSGIAITNISAHNSSVAITYISGSEKQIRVHQVAAGEVITISVSAEDLPFESCWAVLNSGFSMRALAILGDGNACYGYQATGCGACQ